MLPDVGATELMVIAAVALIVVGPKDLPVLMRKVGQFMARMRAMANEFRNSFEDMARQSELDELRREVQALRSGDYLSEAQAATSASTAQVDDIMYEIEQDIMGHDEQPVPAELAPEPAPAPKPRAPRKPKAAAVSAAESDAAVKAPAKPRAPRKPKAAPKVDL